MKNILLVLLILMFNVFLGFAQKIYPIKYSPITYSTYKWDTLTSDWTEFKTSIYVYSNTGKIIREQVTSPYSNFNEEFFYKYDLSDRLSNMTIYKLINGTSKQVYKTDYEYDLYSNLKSQLNYTWDSNINNWINISKTFIAYDAKKNIIDYKSETFFNGSWMVTSAYKKHFEYVNDTLVSESQTEFNKQTNSYDSTYRLLYLYNNKKIATKLVQNYNRNINAFEYDSKYNYYYDLTNQYMSVEIFDYVNSNFIPVKLTDSISYLPGYNSYKLAVTKIYNSNTNKYENYEKYKNTYVDTNKSTFEQSYLWKDSTWVFNISREINFNDFKDNTSTIALHTDTNGVAISFAHNSEHLYDSNNRLLQTITKAYNTNTATYDNFFKYNYNYNPLGIESDVALNSFKVYPNPSKGEFRIVNSSNYAPNIELKVTIYDINWKLIYQNNHQNNSTIKIEDKGIYFVEYNGTIQKVIVE